MNENIRVVTGKFNHRNVRSGDWLSKRWKTDGDYDIFHVDTISASGCTSTEYVRYGGGSLFMVQVLVTTPENLDVEAVKWKDDRIDLDWATREEIERAMLAVKVKQVSTYTLPGSTTVTITPGKEIKAEGKVYSASMLQDLVNTADTLLSSLDQGFPHALSASLTFTFGCEKGVTVEDLTNILKLYNK